jgi:hypothetical protein
LGFEKQEERGSQVNALGINGVGGAMAWDGFTVLECIYFRFGVALLVGAC